MEKKKKKLFTQLISFLVLIIISSLANYTLRFFNLEFRSGIQYIYFGILYILLFLILMQVLVILLKSKIVFLLSFVIIPLYIFIFGMYYALFVGASVDDEFEQEVSGIRFVCTKENLLLNESSKVYFHNYINSFVRPTDSVFSADIEDIQKHDNGESTLDEIYKNSMEDR